MEEERRLAYVGITRAMRRLFISHAWSRMLFGSTQYNPPSRFFDEIPDELIESKGNVTRPLVVRPPELSPARRPWRSRRGDPPPYRRRGVGGGDDRPGERRAPRTGGRRRARGRPGATAPQPSNAQELGLHIGDDVEHPAFGEGVIIDISGMGEKAEAVINFAGVGHEAPGAGLGAAQEAQPLTPAGHSHAWPSSA